MEGVCPSSSSMILYRGRSSGPGVPAIGGVGARVTNAGEGAEGVFRDAGSGTEMGFDALRVFVSADSVNVENICDSLQMAAIWSSPMLENGAHGEGWRRAWANSVAAMVAFSADDR